MIYTEPELGLVWPDPLPARYAEKMSMSSPSHESLLAFLMHALGRKGISSGYTRKWV